LYGAEDTRWPEQPQRLSGRTWDRASKLLAERTENNDDPTDEDNDKHDED
jgi:hypothetical protein